MNNLIVKCQRCNDTGVILEKPIKKKINRYVLIASIVAIIVVATKSLFIKIGPTTGMFLDIVVIGIVVYITDITVTKLLTRKVICPDCKDNKYNIR
jgi:hypothetical protein